MATCLFTAQTICAEMDSGTPNDTTVYTPWFGSPADAATFLVEVQAISRDATLTIDVQTKKVDATDSAAAAPTIGSSISRTATGVGSSRYAGMLELVRIKATLSKGTTDGVVYCTFRMLPVAWELN